MSELNILNPTALSPLNPDFPLPLPPLPGPAVVQAYSGEVYARRLELRGRRIPMQWRHRSRATADSLRQWAQQHETGFFTFQHFETGRYFSGRFMGALEIVQAGYERWDIAAVFEELPGLAIYPANLLKSSEEFDRADWLRNENTVAANTIADPNGRFTADRITPTVGAVDPYVYQDYTGSVAGKTYTALLWMKAASGAPALRLALRNQSGTSRATAVTNLSTGLQRFSVTGAMQAGDTLVQVMVGGDLTWTEAEGAVDSWAAMLVEGTGLDLNGNMVPLFPDWYRDGIFLEERDDFGVDLVKLTGTWAFNASQSLARGGKDYWSSATATPTTDTAEWEYFGYGFRYWARKGADLGIAELSLDGTVLTTVDLYSASGVASAPLLAKDAVLGRHRVKVRKTGTKNASATDYRVIADAIEVLR